jgi:phytoene dehydrogenase-like protein
MSECIAKDPHPEWFCQWLKLTAAWNEALRAYDEETLQSESIWAERDQIENHLAMTPVYTIAGACAVLHWVLEESKGAFTYDGHEAALTNTLTALKGMA